MGRINLSIHPLFYLLGFYYAITGEILVFIICTVTAVIHELGHSFVASNLGYRLNKITLMPFGAVVSGNTDGLKFHDEIKIALAGPFINLAVSLFFIAIWWIYPEFYAYTDIIVSVNLSMALVNLLPIYPLDGGRIVFCFFAEKFGYDRSFIINKIIGGVFALLLIALFVFGAIKGVINFSLLFFSLFVCFGAFSRERENKYVKIFSVLSKDNLKRGMPIKRFAVDKDMQVKKLISILDSRAVNQVEVYENDKKIATLTQDKIEKIIEKANIYSKLGQNL
ncbi:MAG: M50 family metallopeptidase [Clostridia bacterium]|nr:M50 family metallopeptidase [Clostridia bacterium]